jgi:hypothetical protein
MTAEIPLFMYCVIELGCLDYGRNPIVRVLIVLFIPTRLITRDGFGVNSLSDCASA